jgi:hypothetical protein
MVRIVRETLIVKATIAAAMLQTSIQYAKNVFQMMIVHQADLFAQKINVWSNYLMIQPVREIMIVKVAIAAKSLRTVLQRAKNVLQTLIAHQIGLFALTINA